jgi:hypothetical protein
VIIYNGDQGQYGKCHVIILLITFGRISHDFLMKNIYVNIEDKIIIRFYNQINFFISWTILYWAVLLNVGTILTGICKVRTKPNETKSNKTK